MQHCNKKVSTHLLLRTQLYHYSKQTGQWEAVLLQKYVPASIIIDKSEGSRTYNGSAFHVGSDEEHSH